MAADAFSSAALRSYGERFRVSSSFDFPGSLLHSSSSSCSRAQRSPLTGKKGSDDPAFRGFEAKAGHEKSFLEWMAPAAGQLSASSEKGWDVASIATRHGRSPACLGPPWRGLNAVSGNNPAKRFPLDARLANDCSKKKRNFVLRKGKAEKRRPSCVRG